MEGKVEVTKIVKDLDKLIDELGKEQFRLSTSRDKLTKYIGRKLWEDMMHLYKTRGLCRAVCLTGDEQGWAIRQLPDVVGEDAIPVIDEIIADPETAPEARREAGAAKQEIEARLKQTQSHEQQRFINEITESVGQRLEELLHGPQLDNYDGYVYAQFTNEAGEPLEQDKTGIPYASTDQKVKLKVWLQPEPLEGIFSAKVSINDGQKNPNQVMFDIELDTDDLEFTSNHANFLVQPSQDLSPLVFSGVTPKKPRKCQVWVQVSQRNHFVQVVKTQMQVKAKGGK